MTLSEFLLTYRRENGLSQRQLAKIVGISHATIALLEKNKNPSTGKPMTPTVDSLRRISSGLGMTMQELFSIVDVDIDLSEVPDSRFAEMTSLWNSLTDADMDDLLVLARAKAARRG